jgi:aryl-alcohol dehydrogenase-like predicted oxidoreductase
MTPAQAHIAQQAGVISADEAAQGHSISPAFLHHQIASNTAQLDRPKLDLLYLHNPERQANGDLGALHRHLTEAFTACEEAADQGHISGYGVATWSGFASGAFTVTALITAARAAAGSSDVHLRAIQLPVSLVHISPLADALDGRGPITTAAAAGLQVWASAPLHGGELARIVTPELAALIHPGVPSATAALTVVASTPGLTGALLSASAPAHWHQAVTAFQQPPIPATRLRELCRVLRA